MRAPALRIYDEIDVDLFAGGGGASEGFAQALGRSPTIAINHDPAAIAMHIANHPDTHHYCGDIWGYDPVAVCGGYPVGALWASPDCKHFSKAKNGAVKRSKKVRSLAWVVTRWAEAVRPRVILLENVEEFETWGPLVDGQPCPLRKGQTFKRWIASLRKLGYVVEWRLLRACDYGAPTIRRRFFLIARCDGKPIVWPEPTHGPGTSRPWRTAAECIDWSVPCPSIFGREKPLVDATLRRIAHGIKKHVIENPEPFIVDGAAHTLIQEGWGERKGQAPRVPGLHKPMGTQVAGGVKHALVTAFIAKHFGGKSSPGSSLKKPMGTVTTKDHNALVSSFLVQYNGTGTSRSVRKPISTVLTNHHHGLVNAFLIRYDYNGASRSLRKPLATLTTKGRFGLVCVRGEQYEIVDIGMRFLIPREQFRAQGFRDSYIIDPTLDGAPIGVTHQGRCAGNSVPPDVVRAIVAANVGQRKNIAA